jgi:lipopolysaccharide transport system ATP-binding protein
MSDVLAISIRGLSKSYTIAHNRQKHTTLAEAMVSRLKNPLKRPQTETFWALDDISFDIHQGDVLGIIGRNGAGKSTLLKVLSRITEPTKGVIDVYGRIGSLLEVGTGFHQELTGRENIFLNGAILGMRRAEIQKQFDAIVEFAGVSQFLDTPVKRYSSGMYVRLAFAVAAHLNPEILMVDEVLAVGDLEFQKKCLGKMKDVANSGRTVLFVSHQMQAISTLCTKGVYLQKGRLDYIGDVPEAINRYLSSRQTADDGTDPAIKPRRPGSGEMRFTRIAMSKDVYLSVDPIVIEMDVTAYSDRQPGYFVSLEIGNRLGLTILHLDSRLVNVEFLTTPTRRIRYVIEGARLAQGDYTVNAYLCNSWGIIDRFERAVDFTIAPLLPYPASRNDCARYAMIYPQFTVEEVVTAPTAAAQVAAAV